MESFEGADESDLKKLFEQTPDYKYPKYIVAKIGSAEDFWKEEIVFKMLEDTFERKAVSLNECAGFLGVSPQMVRNNFFHRLVIPAGAFPLPMKEYLDNNGHDEDMFWAESRAKRLLADGRWRRITASDAALELGCAVSEFEERMGECYDDKIKEKEEKEKEAKKNKAAAAAKKLNPLEQQIKVSESSATSKYEEIRLKNIMERLAMFQSLDLGSTKAGLDAKGPKKEFKPVDYGTREKSKRLKKIKETNEFRANENNDDDKNAKRTNPVAVNVPALDSIPVKELVALHVDIPYSVKFFSSLSREVTLHDQREKVDEEEDEISVRIYFLNLVPR